MDDPYLTSTTTPTEPVSTPQPPPPSAEKSTPSPRTLGKIRALRLYFAHYLSRAGQSTDRTLLRLARLLSTPGGTDTLLCTTSYTLTLISALLSRLLERKLANLASNITSKVEPVLLPGESLIASVPAPRSTALLAQAAGSSKALTSVISDYRIFVRLWGCVGLYTWARETYLNPLPASASTKDKILRNLTWSTIATSVGFQVLENGAYLSSKGVLMGASWAGEQGKTREGKWWLWSSRFWAAYVGVELVRLGVLNYYYEEGVVGSEGEKDKKIRNSDVDRLWWRDLASNVAFAPMTMHWSTEQGLLSEWAIGTFGVFAGGPLLKEAWRKTA